MKIKLLGIPYDKGSSYLQGASKGPQRIRDMATSGSANDYSETLTRVKFGEDLVLLPDLHFGDKTGKQAYDIIYDGISEAINKEETIISLGGDHAISYPIIAAHASVWGQQVIHILQIDAHSDLYEDFEGDPYSHASPFARLFEGQHIASLTQVGIRCLTPHLLEQTQGYKVNCITMQELDLSFIEHLNGPLYITIDLDGLDPSYAPGVSHHEPGGLSTRQVIDMIQRIKCPIIGADIVELNPDRDINDTTAMVAYKLVKEVYATMDRNFPM